MGISRSQFIKLERGERGMTARTINLAAKAFGVAPSTILDDASSDEIQNTELVLAPSRVVPVPVVGTVEAGTFRAVEDISQEEPEFVLAAQDPQYPSARISAFDVAGDSMNALKPRPIFPGDRVIGINFEDLENRVPIRDGMVVVVERLRDGGHIREWSVKQVELYEDRIEFHPRSTNRKHQPIIVQRDLEADDGQEVSILAIVRRVINEFPW